MFEATQFVVVYYSSPRMEKHWVLGTELCPPPRLTFLCCNLNPQCDWIWR